MSNKLQDKRLHLSQDCIRIFKNAAKSKGMAGAKPLMQQVLENYALKLKIKSDEQCR
jgi:histone H3/H4